MDHAALIAAARREACAAARKLNLNCEEDLQELPVVVSTNKRITAKCGTFSSVAKNGLGLITIYPHMVPTPEDFEATLLHEFGHALVHYLLHGANDRGGCHGKAWQYVMLTMGRAPSKYHTLKKTDAAPATVYEKRSR